MPSTPRNPLRRLALALHPGLQPPKEGMSGLCLDPAAGQLSCPGEASALRARRRLLGGEGPQTPHVAWGRPREKSLEGDTGGTQPGRAPEGTWLSISPSYQLLNSQGGRKFPPSDRKGIKLGRTGLAPEAQDKGELGPGHSPPILHLHHRMPFDSHFSA